MAGGIGAGCWFLRSTNTCTKRPAASAVDLERKGNHVQFGILSSVGIGVEGGEEDRPQ